MPEELEQTHSSLYFPKVVSDFQEEKRREEQARIDKIRLAEELEQSRRERIRKRREQFVRNLLAGIFGVGGVILLMLLALLIRLIF